MLAQPPLTSPLQPDMTCVPRVPAVSQLLLLLLHSPCSASPCPAPGFAPLRLRLSICSQMRSFGNNQINSGGGAAHSGGRVP